MKTILAPPSSKLLMPNVNLVITSLRHARMIEDQKDSAFFKYKIPASLKEFHIRIAEQCMSRIFEDQKKVCLLYYCICVWVCIFFELTIN